MENKMSILEIVRLRQKQILEYKDRTEKEDNERTALKVAFFQPIRNAITELSEYGATYLKNGVIASLEPMRDDAHEFQLIFLKPDSEAYGGIMARAYLDINYVPLIGMSDSSDSVFNLHGIKSYSNADSAALKLAELLAPHLILPRPKSAHSASE